MYNNPDWKWVYLNVSLNTDTYSLKKIKSFGLWHYPVLGSRWTLAVSSNSKIQKWIISRLDVRQTTYTYVDFKEGELEQFLDELDQMMECLYAK